MEQEGRLIRLRATNLSNVCLDIDVPLRGAMMNAWACGDLAAVKARAATRETAT